MKLAENIDTILAEIVIFTYLEQNTSRKNRQLYEPLRFHTNERPGRVGDHAGLTRQKVALPV